MSDEQKLRALIDEFGLSQWKDQILERAKPSIRITPHKVDENTLTLGVSKLGGLPDLPPNVTWPQFKDESLFFVGQLNLKELQPYTTEAMLPSDGLLSFFVRDEYFYTSEFALNPNAWRVFYFTDSEIDQLKRTQRPIDIAPMTWIYEPCAMDFAQELTLPEEVQRLTTPDTKDDDWRRYSEFRHKFVFGDHNNSVTRVLGNPHSLQDSDIYFQCEAISQGHQFIPKDWIQDRARQEKAHSEWQLLFQVDSEGAANMLWEDTGLLYFCIKRQALQERRFAETYVYIEGV
jgi:uncharacterized protein YwqG